MIAVGIADNQSYNLLGFLKRGIITSEIWYNDDKLLGKIKKQIVNIDKQNKFLSIDGQSSRRIIAILLQEENNFKLLMNLREATIDDARQLFEWANDPIMRANSFSQKNIDWDEHINWLDKRLSSDNSKIFIAMIKDENIGQIRFDKNCNDVLIDFFIDNKFRGKRLGTQMLFSGCEKVLESWKNVGNIIGEVKQNNLASCKVFTKAGFDLHSQFDGIIIFKKKLIEL